MRSPGMQVRKTCTTVIHKPKARRSLIKLLLPIAALLIFVSSFWVNFNITSASNTIRQANVNDLTNSAQTTTVNQSVAYAAVENEWLSSVFGPNPVGATIHVTTTSQAIGVDGFCSLTEAIYAANFDSNIAINATNPDSFVFTECEPGNGDDTIVLPAGGVVTMSSIVDDAHNYMGPTATPIIFSNITIEANGARFQHAPNGINFRAFAVGNASIALPNGSTASGTGNLTIRNAYIKGFTVKGGNGGTGGGGGMGAGGAIYVHNGELTVDSSTFEANGAEGGRGNLGASKGGGGGGGLAGNGGNASFCCSGGGGGGGARGNGGHSSPEGGDVTKGGGGGGTVENGESDIASLGGGSGTGGFKCGGSGGNFTALFFRDGEDGVCAGGGGGGGEGTGDASILVQADGGDGAYGGGGGGGGPTESGGDGGFGGGGGAGQDDDGGDGGFGAGGGAGDGPGDGGFFGGDASEDNGGGGAGFGGAIFNHNGSVRIYNSTLTGNFVTRGLGGAIPGFTPGQNGQDAGGAIFSVNGNVEIYHSTVSGNASTGSLGGVTFINISFVLGQVPAVKSFILRNTIIANNGSRECGVAGVNIDKSGSGNLIVQNDPGAPCQNVVSTNDPQLGPLQVNAPGVTPTMAIDENSPALDAGDDGFGLPVDQRGVPRPRGDHSDIGAYELGCPGLMCPGNIVQSNDVDQCGAIVNYSVPTPDASCPIQFSHPSGSFFPLGTTTVTWTRGSESCSFTVTVNDTQKPTVSAPANLTVSNAPGECSANLNPGSATASDNCSGATVSGTRSDGLPLTSPYPVGTTTINWTTTDAFGNTSANSAQQTITVNDTEGPTVTNVSALPVVLSPPNHTMRDVAVNYSAIDNCSSANCVLSVASNESVNGTGDGDTAPDWEVIDKTHVRLRAERAANGNGRIYTITITCTDAVGNITTKQTNVVVAHNIRSPLSGSAFKIKTPVTFSGTFWDVPGKTHTARWDFGDFSTEGIVTEPKGLTNGTVTGTYTFSTPGIYKVSLKVTDNTGTSTSVSTAGDLEAIVVIYDPLGGYTIGGGWVPVGPRSYLANPSLSGKLGFGFNSKYSNATNPKGNALIRFALANFEFTSLNYDYLSISGGKAQFRGFGKINGDAGYNFILTVIDGDVKGSDGIDRFRIKIWSKSTGALVFDNQAGASDAADPITPVGLGSEITVKK